MNKILNLLIKNFKYIKNNILYETNKHTEKIGTKLWTIKTEEKDITKM